MTPKRIQMSRQHPWRAEHPDAVIVDRRTMWGNPYRVCDGCTAYQAVEQFRDMLARAPLGDGQWGCEGETVYETIRRELAGQDLACWCKIGDPCHGDILLAIARGDEP